VAAHRRRELAARAALGEARRAAAAAEAALGAGRGAGDVLFVAIGTGIGGAIVVEGHPYGGAHGRAGEIGHTVADPDGPPCACGARGCVEALASAAAIERAYAETGAGDGASAREVAALAGAHDPAARAVWDRAVAALAAGLADAITLLDPARVVIGGGLAEAGPALLEPVAAAVAEHLTLGPAPPIVGAELGAEAGCRGAALLAWQALGRAAVAG
jgi:glucokinase